MKRKTILRAIIVVGLSFFLGMISPKAATVYITASSSSKTYVVGNKVNVTVRLSSSTALGSWRYDISYNTAYLKMLSGDSPALGNTENSTTKSKTDYYSFTALKSGNVSVSIKNASVASFEEQYMTTSITNSSFKIITQAELEASYSSNNNLSSLSIDNAVLSPVFSSSVTNYSVELAPNTTSINVNAAVADSKANVSGTGAVAVVDGLNVVNVVVTAENGTTKTYIINVTVKELNPIEVTVDGEKFNVVRKPGIYEAPVNFDQTTVKMGEESVLAYNNKKIGTIVGLKDANDKVSLYLYDLEKKEYNPYYSATIGGINIYLSDDYNKTDIPSGYNKTTLKIGDLTVKAYHYKSEDNFYLVYGVNTLNGKDNFYLYDKSKGTIQRFYDDQIVDMKNYQDKIEIVALIAISLLGITIIYKLLSLVKRLNLKKGKLKNNIAQDSVIEVTDEIKSNKKKR